MFFTKVVALVSVSSGCLILAWSLAVTRTDQEGASKSLTIGHFKDEPVEVVSIRLGGRTLVPGDLFTPTEGWTKGLEITIKNVSERPVSYVTVALLTSAPPGTSDSISSSEYRFGSHPDSDSEPTFLQPQETARLAHEFTLGNATDPRPAQILIQTVFWDNDNSRMWGTGKILRRKSESEPVYERDQPMVRRIAPKGHQS